MSLHPDAHKVCRGPLTSAPSSPPGACCQSAWSRTPSSAAAAEGHTTQPAPPVQLIKAQHSPCATLSFDRPVPRIGLRNPGSGLPCDRSPGSSHRNRRPDRETPVSPRIPLGGAHPAPTCVVLKIFTQPSCEDRPTRHRLTYGNRLKSSRVLSRHRALRVRSLWRGPHLRC